MAFDTMLPVYYNNNHKFIERKLSATMIKNSKIFEKDEIRWVCIDDIPKMRKKFRPYFQTKVDMILDQRGKIDEFIRDALRVKKGTKNKTRKNKRKGG
jgi:transcription termination factor NusB